MSELTRDVSNALMAAAAAATTAAQVTARLLMEAEREVAPLAAAVGRAEKQIEALEAEKCAAERRWAATQVELTTAQAEIERLLRLCTEYARKDAAYTALRKDSGR